MKFQNVIFGRWPIGRPIINPKVWSGPKMNFSKFFFICPKLMKKIQEITTPQKQGPFFWGGGGANYFLELKILLVEIFFFNSWGVMYRHVNVYKNRALVYDHSQSQVPLLPNVIGIFYLSLLYLCHFVCFLLVSPLYIL